MRKSDDVASGPSSIITTDNPAYVRDAIIEPAIGRDVLSLGAVRRPALLRQVFAIATASPAQIVSLQKLQGQLQDKGALETVAHYLAMLQEAYLVSPLDRFSTRADRRTTRRRRAGATPRRPSAAARSGCRASARGRKQSIHVWPRATATKRRQRSSASAESRAERTGRRARCVSRAQGRRSPLRLRRGCRCERSAPPDRSATRRRAGPE